jgi:translation initiation factor IF-2
LAAPPKVRIYELSKILGISNKDLMTYLEETFQLHPKSHSSTVEQDVAEKATAYFKDKQSSAPSSSPSKISTGSKSTPVPPEKPLPLVFIATPEAPPEEPKPIERPKAIVPQRAPEPPLPAVGTVIGPRISGGGNASARTLEKPSQPSPTSDATASVQERPVQQPYRGQGHQYQQGQYGNPQQQGQRPPQQQGQYGTQQQQGQRPPQQQGQYGAQQQQGQRPPQQQGQYGTQQQQGQRPPQQQGQYGTQQQQGQRPPQQQGQYGNPQQQGQRPPQQQGQYGNPQQQQPPSQEIPAKQGFGKPAPRGGQPQKGAQHRKDNSRQEQQRLEQLRLEQLQLNAASSEPEVDTPKPPVQITEPLTLTELAKKLDTRETEIIKHLFMKGILVTVNQTLDVEYARSVSQQMGYEVEVPDPEEGKGQEEIYSQHTLAQKKETPEEASDTWGHRSPVVSIMGHVDHGKTSLLDAIRETRHKIVDGEAGGITQSIGAYSVEKNDQRIVFLDTPGHEAFTAMRLRGAKATDIAILVVAADDGVMPQTIEAINHAKAAKIPIIVAINKIDKPDADPDKILIQLSEHGLVAEKWGGETVTVEVSALLREGLDTLLEMILLVSELLELKADPKVSAEGVIIESQLDKRKGPIATVLVQNGTLTIGDNILIGAVGGRIRALISDTGERIEHAGPSTPVEILGLDEVPLAGDPFIVIQDEKQFKKQLQEEKLRYRDERLGNRTRMQGLMSRSQDGLKKIQEGEQQKAQGEFNVIVKADTQGSTEALNNSLLRLTTDEIRLNIIHSGTGEISEADVTLASASNAVIIGFTVKEDNNAQRVAEAENVKILTFDVIYHITEAVEKLMLGKLAPDLREVEIGAAEVRQLFTVGKNIVIAGCMVQQGKITRNARATLVRNNKEIFSGSLENLKRFKDDVKEVATGYECGISFAKFNDVQIGDIIKAFITEELERTSLT